MRKRLAAVGLGMILGANGAGAQPPQLPPPQFPVQPPRPLSPQLPQFPAPVYPPSPTTPGGTVPGTPGAGPGQPQFPVQPPRPLSPQLPLPPQFPAAPVYPLPTTPGMSSPGAPGQPLPPAMLPPINTPPAANAPNTPPGPIAATEVPLPQPEQKVPFSAPDVTVKRVIGGWQVWAGQKMLRDLGENENNARDLARVLRDLRPTEWVAIGGAKPIVEYGLVNGRPPVAAGGPDMKAGDPNAGANVPAAFNGPVVTGAGAKVVVPIDLQTARVEPIRGVWCVRDDANLLFNFGTDKAGAEQAIAVIRKYGFNRVGLVGDVRQPVMSYLFVSLDADRPKVAGGQLLVNAQIDALARTGIPVPGVGFTGEMIKLDPRKVEARKDGAEWVVASGTEVLGRFGPTEWAAREAARTVQDARFTEFCRLGGTSGLTFFLQNGKAPTRAPFNAQARAFDLTSLKVQELNGKWAVTEGNRHLLDVSGPQEGEVVVRVLKAYGFDQFAHLSARGATGGIRYLVKNR